MSDPKRADKIRERMIAMDYELGFRHLAVPDIAWLLAENERLEKQVQEMRGIAAAEAMATPRFWASADVPLRAAYTNGLRQASKDVLAWVCKLFPACEHAQCSTANDISRELSSAADTYCKGAPTVNDPRSHLIDLIGQIHDHAYDGDVYEPDDLRATIDAVYESGRAAGLREGADLAETWGAADDEFGLDADVLPGAIAAAIRARAKEPGA